MILKKSIVFAILILFAIPTCLICADDPKNRPSGQNKKMDLMERLNLGANMDLSQYRMRQPSLMEKKWKDYRDFMEHRNLNRSPNNPEWDVEYMMRNFF
jgi:hypothetical protein